MSNSTTAATFTDDVIGCELLADPHGATVENLTQTGDVWTVTYACNSSYDWKEGSRLRQCHVTEGNWSGEPIVCFYDDPILRAELIGGIVGGVFFILLIVLTIDFIYHKRRKGRGRRPKRITDYDEHPRPTSFIISYAPSDYDLMFGKPPPQPGLHSPDVIKDVTKPKLKTKGKSLKKKASVSSADSKPKPLHKLDPIEPPVEGKKKKKKKVQPVSEDSQDNLVSSKERFEEHADANPVHDRPTSKVKKGKKKKKATPPLESYTVPDPELQPHQDNNTSQPKFPKPSHSQPLYSQMSHDPDADPGYYDRNDDQRSHGKRSKRPIVLPPAEFRSDSQEYGGDQRVQPQRAKKVRMIPPEYVDEYNEGQRDYDKYQRHANDQRHYNNPQIRSRKPKSAMPPPEETYFKNEYGISQESWGNTDDEEPYGNQHHQRSHLGTHHTLPDHRIETNPQRDHRRTGHPEIYHGDSHHRGPQSPRSPYHGEIDLNPRVSHPGLSLNLDQYSIEDEMVVPQTPRPAPRKLPSVPPEPVGGRTQRQDPNQSWGYSDGPDDGNSGMLY